MDLKKALPLLDKFFAWATPKRVLMLAFAAMACIISLTFFEHRSSVIEIFKAKDLAPPELSVVLADDTRKKIEELVNRSPDVNTVMIVAANIRVNQREMVYYFSDDPVVDFTIKAYANSHGSAQTIFSHDEKNNAQMVSVINGEFGCYKYEDTSNNVMAPKLAQRTPTICRISLPPYYGEFSGYVSIGLTHVPDEALQNEIRIAATRLATEIYFKSIKRR